MQEIFLSLCHIFKGGLAVRVMPGICETPIFKPEQYVLLIDRLMHRILD
jgi:hypothetical protein